MCYKNCAILSKSRDKFKLLCPLISNTRLGKNRGRTIGVMPFNSLFVIKLKYEVESEIYQVNIIIERRLMKV